MPVVGSIGNAMGTIETTKDKSLSLTMNIARGQISYDDFTNWINDYYSGAITRYVLWDFTEADVSGISSKEYEKIAALVKKKSDQKEGKKGGKSALVHSQDVGFGLGRMFEALSRMEGIEFEFKSFRCMAEAKKWLGL